jgi:hypothetical protein
VRKPGTDVPASGDDHGYGGDDYDRWNGGRGEDHGYGDPEDA